MSTLLDEAFDRVAFAGFELPNGFVNHGPMACEALDVLGRSEDLPAWSARFARSGGTPVEPVSPRQFEPDQALGEYRLLPEWIGWFERAIGRDGWPHVVATWTPRLIPGLAVALFHGAIRVAHATRAIATADTASRRAELARALGYWAARFQPGAQPHVAHGVDDVRAGVLESAAGAARRYLGTPDIFRLHGITGAMAVELLVPHLSASDGSAALGQLKAEEDAMTGGGHLAAEPISVAGTDDETLAATAAHSGDPHVVKLVEACRRGSQATGDLVFAAAAELVAARR